MRTENHPDMGHVQARTQASTDPAGFRGPASEPNKQDPPADIPDMS
jgi:hypothetical protein